MSYASVRARMTRLMAKAIALGCENYGLTPKPEAIEAAALAMVEAQFKGTVFDTQAIEKEHP